MDADVEPTRRVVTVVFADMVGSTGLAERLDAEVVRSIQARYFGVLRRTTEAHGGTVEKYIGDAVMAVFGVPDLHEDDALRAVRAAAAMADALADLRSELERRYGLVIGLRVGVHTGQVVAALAPDALVTGDAVNVAARLQQAAAVGEVVLGHDTFELVRDVVHADDLGTVELRGRDRGQRAWRFRGFRAASPEDGARRSPFVGRDAELDALGAALERTVTDATGRLVMVVGPAGVGKSRLVRVFAERAARIATVLRGRCLAYGDVTNGAIIQVLREAAGATALDDPATVTRALGRLVAAEDEAARIETVVGAVLGASDATVASEDVAWALQSIVRRIASRQPLVVVVEDLHWADPALLDTLEWLPTAVERPVLVLGTARDDLLARRQSWRDQESVTVVTVTPLTSAVSQRLIGALPGGSALPGELRERIEAVAEGNPLFIEEMLGKLVDDGRLQPVNGGWELTGDGSGIAVPPSVALLLAARIDALDPAERRVAERAAVVGRWFHRDAVHHLLPDEEQGSLDGALAALAGRDVIVAAGDDAPRSFRFRHVLIRDAAYERLPKLRRSDLHARFAAWLVGPDASQAFFADRIELVATHLASAAQYRAELGLTDDGPDDLAARAVEALAAAGERAARLNAHAVAARYYEQALEIGRRHLDTAGLIAIAASAIDEAFLAGEADASLAIARELVALSERVGDPTTEGLAHERLGRLLAEVGDADAALAELRRAVALVPEGPSAARTLVLGSLARWLMLADRFEESRPVADQAVAVGREAGAEAELAGALITLAMSLGRGEALAGQLALIDEAEALGVRSGSAWQIMRAVNNRAALLGDAGRLEEREREDRRATILLEELGVLDGAGVHALLNEVDYLIQRGDLAGAERLGERVLSRPRAGAIGVRAHALQGCVALAQGRMRDAERAFARAGSAPAWGAGESVMEMQETRAWLAIAQGRWRDALRDLADVAGRVRPANVDLRLRLAARTMQALAARADAARVSEDRDELAAAIADAAALETEATTMAATAGAGDRYSQRGAIDLGLALAERTRVDGRSDPARWSAAADAARAAGYHLWEVEARARLAEAHALAGGATAAYEAARRRTLELVQATGAVFVLPILDRSEHLARRSLTQ